MLKERLANTVDYFSIDLLLRTLFLPFRQISAGHVNGPLGVKFRAFLDRIISRMIGGLIRSTMIIFGTAAIVVHSIVGGIVLVIWAFIPLLPVIGLILFTAGWMPWNL